MSKRNNWIPWKDLQGFNGITENAVFPNHLNEVHYQPRTLIDETLEIIDPTPNVHTMFVQFNEKYFWNKLLPVQVKWSQRMTTCAGTCTFHPRNRECIIALSAPLLKLRPRKDLVETLLHEMIHGYLFLTNNNRDRNGHGPEFCKHMHRINKDAGTKITIYHNFHDEVKLYQQHWWRCDGPCKNRPPYFGTVRRAMNRAPGPADYWFKEHQYNCGGKFTKIREPEPKSNTKSKDKESVKPPQSINTIDKYIMSGSSKNSFNNVNSNIKSPLNGYQKLGTNTNNVYGFSTGGPGSCPKKSQANNPSSQSQLPDRMKFSGVLGGNATNKSILLDKYLSSVTEESRKKSEVMKSSVQCPICNIKLPDNTINDHIDMCLEANDNNDPPTKRSRTSNTSSKNTETSTDAENFHTCPICEQKFLPDLINNHLDECLLKKKHNNTNQTRSGNTRNNHNNDQNMAAASSSSSSSSSRSLHECPICSNFYAEDIIHDHVNACLTDEDKSEPRKKRKKKSIEDLSTSSINVKTDTKNSIKCPTCDKSIRLVDYIVHAELCLAAEKAGRDIILIDDDDDDDDNNDKPGSSNGIKSMSNTYKCLVCNRMIDKSILLSEHLDSCVSINYRDTNYDDSNSKPLSIDVDEIEDDNEDEDQEQEQKHLCPICMSMIEKNLMAQHVDECITKVS